MINKDLGMVTAYAYAVSKGYTGTEEEFAALMADYAEVGERAEAAATAAAASATAASGSASDSAASATAAEGFAGNASTSAGNASQAAQNASQSASAASGSATSAAGSATAAAGSATTAGNKATEAAQSATAAAGSATTAGASATAAQAAQTAAEAAQTAAETAQGAAEDAAESVEGKAAQIDQNTEDISLLKSQLEAVDATLIAEEASGTIASFTDGADGYPMRSVEVSMEPIQNLNGQDAPYPAGGGKNLLPNDLASGTIGNGVTVFVDASGVISFSGTSTAITIFNIKTDVNNLLETGVNYILSGCTGGTFDTYRFEIYKTVGNNVVNYNGDTPFSLLDTDSGCYCRIVIASGSNMSGVKISPMIRLASVTDATFAPYSNICPISGRQSVTVTRTGKNMFDQDTKYASLKQADGSFLGVMGSSVITIHTNIPSAMVGQQVTFSAMMKVPSGSTITNLRVMANVGGASRNGTLVNGSDYSLSYITFTPSSADDYVCLSFGSGGSQQAQFKDVMLALGTDTAYEPYDGASVTVQLGQTVYGGTVDVVSGKMVVDRAMVTYDGSENWYTGAITGGVKHRMVLDSLPRGIKTVTSNAEIPDVVTNILPAVSAEDTWSAINGIAMQTRYGWRIYCDAYNTSDVAPWKAYLAEHPLTIAYKLAQPITVQLTPEQLTTILGTNNVWSDADSVTVDYVADTKLYIQKAIAAALANA